MHALRLDCFRLCASYSSARALRLFLTQRPFRPVVTMRLWQSARRRSAVRWLCPLLNVAHRAMCQLAAIDLPVRTRIGEGFVIHHGWGAVLSDSAVIGRNVTLMHGATIGQADDIAADGTRRSAAPVIGDGCWIGPGAVIVGACTLGAGCRVLANAVVTPGDYPAASLLGGVPARVLRSGVAADILNPVPPASHLPAAAASIPS